MKKFYSVVVMQLICIASISRLFAQSSDTISLKPVDVMGSRAAVFSGGVTTILSDSSKNSPFNNQTVSELLSANSSVFIKTYGSGGSATISSRGTEARHNAVLWNGFNINSSSLGLTDLSMIPAGLTDNITLLHGGSSPVNGNSAIGSTLVFENDFPQFKSFNNTTLVAEAGSYENIHGSIYSKWSTTYMESKTFLFYDGAKNNFNYTNFTHREQPDVTQKHASFSNSGIVQDFHFKIGKQQIISAGFWYQDTDRELPPLMTSPNNNATQRDSTWRMYLGYKMIYKKSILSLKGAYFREFQFYDDERLQYNYNYLVNNSFAEVEWRTVLNDKLILNSGISFNQGQASFEEYSGTQKRNTTALFSGLRYDFTKNWQINFNLRKEFSSSTTPPFSPSIVIQGGLYKKYILFLVKAGHNYSLPSLNDLYWNPGGNAALKPENAWSEEVSLIFFKNHKNLPSAIVTGFISNVANWIKWQPAAGGIYSPDNLRKVNSRGIETALNYSKKFNSLILITSIHHTWCLSEVSKVYRASEKVTIDKQLMYVPEHIFNSIIKISWKTFSVFMTNTYTGIRYTTSDNSTWLESYTITNLSVEKSFIKIPMPVTLYFKIMNLTDATYQVMAYRPMPGRWFSAGIKINFNIPNK